MRYANAQDIFPHDVLLTMQQFVEGAYVYIPKKPDNRKKWGDNTRSKIKTKERNEEIYANYKAGLAVSDLAALYYLSDKSIQRIITQGRKQEN